MTWCGRNFLSIGTDIKQKIYTSEKFGSGVNCRLLCRHYDLPHVSINSTLVWTFGHFLLYNKNPKITSPLLAEDTTIYVSTSLLQLSRFQGNITYPSTFFKSGLGQRALTPEEIAGCFSLSDLHKIGITLLTCNELVPVKLLQMIQ